MNHIARLTLILLLFFLGSCVVSKKKYEDLSVKKSSLELEKAELEALKDSLSLVNNEETTRANSCENEVAKLSADTTKLAELYRKLVKDYSELAEVSDKDAQNLSKQLQRVGKLMGELETRDRDIAQREAQITHLNDDLKEREKNLKELEKRIAEKDKAVTDIKNKINKALVSVQQEGLTVEIREGKVYVSLPQALLFKSGSYFVDNKGKQALLQIAGALKEQEDITIDVEGHTDDVPYKGSGPISDNWDLGVKRATSVVRILEKGGIDPKRLIASGRAEYKPKVEGKTEEARKENRRIEVIVSPKLEELFKLLNNK